MDTYGGCILIPSIVPNAINHNWLVVEPTPLKNDGVKVSWDDDIPNWMGKIKVPIHQPDSDFWLYTCEKNACTTGKNDGIADVPCWKTIDIIWENYNISLTWILRPFGDHFPRYNGKRSWYPPISSASWWGNPRTGNFVMGKSSNQMGDFPLPTCWLSEGTLW